MKTIRDLRQARGSAQFDLALKVGVQPRAVYPREQGQRLPRVALMGRFGVVFGLCTGDAGLVSPAESGIASLAPQADRRPVPSS